ncbi:putative WRKY transcription factor 35 [Hordeum vulgare]|nr:putative WRKY transcription factor 35 [Hordeum vulgare]
MLRRKEMVSSSSSDSRSRSSRSSALLPVKPEPKEELLEWRAGTDGVVTNEPGASSYLIKPKLELSLLRVKQEHLAMATDDETTLKWARDDYVREEMERQHRALVEIAARCRGRKERTTSSSSTTATRRHPDIPTPFATVTQGRGAVRTAAERRTTTATTSTTTMTTPTSTSFSACKRRRRRAAAT